MGDLALFDQGGANVPAHIRAAFGTVDNADLSSGVNGGFPVLSIKGKVWHVVQGGARTLLTNADGEPRSSIEVVIIKANKHVSKIYYADGYTEGSDAAPSCSSHDGITPSPDGSDIQAKSCAACPHNVWGSRITENGAKGKACSDARRLAVAPAGVLDNPMLLRVPAASLKELQVFGDQLAKRGVPYQAMVTKIGFDHTVAHQKLTFAPVRWLDEAEVAKVAETMGGSLVGQIIGDSPSPAIAAPNVLDGMAGAPAANVAAVAPAEVAQAPAPAPAAEPVKATRAPRKAAAAAAPAEVAQAIAPAPAADGFGAPPPAAAADGFGAPAAKAAAPAAAAPKRDHSALLAEAGASLDEVLSAAFDDE